MTPPPARPIRSTTNRWRQRLSRSYTAATPTTLCTSTVSSTTPSANTCSGQDQARLPWPTTIGARQPNWAVIERVYERGGYEGETRITQAEYETVRLDPYVTEAETALAGVLSQRDNAVFVFPGGAGGNIAVETWTAVAQWDLQEDDGVMHAVRYGLDEDDAEQSQTLANLKSRATSAAASDNLAGSRVATISGITQHYQDIGAYGDITPDSETTTFTPNQPPPVSACRDSSVISGFALVARLRRPAGHQRRPSERRAAQLEQESRVGQLDRSDYRWLTHEGDWHCPPQQRSTRDHS